MPVHHSREKHNVLLKKYEEYAAKAIRSIQGKTLQLNAVTPFVRYSLRRTAYIFIFLLDK